MSVRIVWNADSTFDASSADVSINDSPFSAAHHQKSQLTSLEGGEPNPPAKDFASSVGTARRCLRSLLLPTNMMTIFESAWSRSSLSQRVTLTYVPCFAMS